MVICFNREEIALLKSSKIQKIRKGGDIVLKVLSSVSQPKSMFCNPNFDSKIDVHEISFCK